MAQGDIVYERYSFDFNDGMAKPLGHDGKPFKLGEIQRYENFVPADQEERALHVVATLGWETSQSNVRKQEYGPVIDFAAKTLDCRANTGLPRYSRVLLRRLEETAGMDFQADRLRLLELCSGHDTIKFPWVTSPFHDHHWLFTDTTVLMSLQSDIVVCLDLAAGGPRTVRVEIPMQARSALVLSGDAARRQINVDASSCLTRCLLLTYNCVKSGPIAGMSEPDLRCIQYFRDKYVGISNNEFLTQFMDCVYTDPGENFPLMIYSFDQHHLPIDVLKNVVEQNYKQLPIQTLKIIDGFGDTNLLMENEAGEKVWGKLAIESLYITEETLEAGLRLQDWMSEQKDMRVAKVIRPGVELSLQESRRTSISTGQFSIAIERNRVHLVWLMEYLGDLKLYGQHMDVCECFRKVGRTIVLFHKEAAKYLASHPEHKRFEDFLSETSYENDLDVFYKKAFLAPDHNKRKLLVCCLRRLHRWLRQQPEDEVSIPKGVIHTYFHPESLMGDVKSSGPFSIVHFAHIRHGFLLTDIILALLRFYVFFRIRLDGDKMPHFEECMKYLLEGYGRHLDAAEKKHLDSFLLSLCAVYLIQTWEQLAAARAEVEQVAGSSKVAIADELQKSVQVGFELLEYLCVNEEKLG